MRGPVTAERGRHGEGEEEERAGLRRLGHSGMGGMRDRVALACFVVEGG